jgi:hypothetical protein
MKHRDFTRHDVTRRRLLGALGVGGLASLPARVTAEDTVDLRVAGGPFCPYGPWARRSDAIAVCQRYPSRISAYRTSRDQPVRREFTYLYATAGPRRPVGERFDEQRLLTGVRLKDVLDQAGVKPGAIQVRFGGLDEPVISGAPKFMKSLAIDHARDGEVMVAFGMNGEQLDLLNGLPFKLIVPGWCAARRQRGRHRPALRVGARLVRRDRCGPRAPDPMMSSSRSSRWLD